MSGHSPLPWSIDRAEVGELWIADARRESPVCMITGAGHITERDEADAALIVEAVNLHDAMRALLISALPYVRNGLEFVSEETAARKLIEQIEAALGPSAGQPVSSPGET